MRRNSRKIEYEDVKKKKYRIDPKRIAKLLRQYGSLPKVSLVIGIPYSTLYSTLKQKLGGNFKQFMHQFKRRHIRRLSHKDKIRAALKVPKTVRIQERDKEYVCEKDKLIKLFEEHGSLQKVSEITNIPCSVLYNLFKIKLDLDIPRKAKKTKYKYNIDKLVRLYKKHGFLPYVSKITGIPTHSLYGMLTKHFGMKLFEVRKKLGIRRSCLKRRDLERNSSRYQQIKEAYERLGTLAKAGEELHLTRERVRQILNQGEKRGVFIYELNREKRFREILQKYDRGSLIKEIRMLISPSRICMKLGIKISDFKKLLEYFTIEYKEYHLSAVMGKTAEKYSQIVDAIGHHPTTTEMNTKTEWRAIWGAIDRYWGNIDNFRKEYGIEKPKQKVHTNTLLAFQKSKEKRNLIKKEKIEKVIYLIKQKGPISLALIRNKLVLKPAMAWIYIRELLEKGLISKTGKGNQVRYMTNL